ncbi:hypothetical protein D4764_0096660, partial [Takifugu flavidus]
GYSRSFKRQALREFLETKPVHVSSVIPLKFSDDSAAVGFITDGDDTEYRELIQDLVDWSLRNNLQINAGKTKELVHGELLGSCQPKTVQRQISKAKLETTIVSQFSQFLLLL